MRKAVIDIGSNTINLVIGELVNGQLKLLLDVKNHAKLAKGGINQKKMTPEALQRGYNAISSHLEECKKYKVAPEKIVSFATATIRDTTNGNEFVATVKKSFGLHIEIIDGLREAELIYKGVENGFPMTDKNILILDIGGGSNEFIFANNDGIKWKHSFSLGVSRMLEKFHPSEPITKTEISDIKKHFKSELSLLFENVQPQGVYGLVGSSGSFDTIRNMILTSKKLENDLSTTWMELENEDLSKLMEQLILSTAEQRKKMPGMVLLRVDYMVIAAIFISVIIEELKIKKVFQCNYALTEGALLL